MFNFIVGKIVSKSDGNIVLESNNIGFEINVSNNTLTQLPVIGEAVKIFTYLNVREDDISIFGFANLEEKSVFLSLITVSGIGPKVALSILSGMKLSDLTIAIVGGDVKLLSTIKGLGKKTSERIVLELQDKIAAVRMGDGVKASSVSNSNIDDATDALISLGLQKGEAYKIARACATEESSVEEILTRALKMMGR